MSSSHFEESDPPVEQFYSFVPDSDDEVERYSEMRTKPAVGNQFKLYSTSNLNYFESGAKSTPLKKAIQPFPTTLEQKSKNAALTKRNSSGMTYESLSEEGSSDDELPKPMYRNHQLLGDSQLVRFSKQILGMKEVTRAVAYCVSGQRIQGLHNMLISKEYKLHRNVILMIGTNDLRHNSTLARMKESYLKLLEVLKELTDKIVLVTIPPIQCMADSVQHWRTFEGFNRFILQQHNGRHIFVVDFGQHLVGYTGFNGCKEYFEELYAASPDKKDLMHLNKKGFLLLRFLLNLHYFSSIN